MLDQYKYISIIYGSSGRDCALYLADQINKMHVGDGFPVKTHLLADEILNSRAILDTIKELILSSEACIVILTFDDVEQTRVRQNVLIEIGMAASCIDREKCFYISERLPLPEDFPSDLKTSINPNLFDKDNLEEVFAKLRPVICKQLQLKSNRGLLAEQDYDFDYRNLLFDIPSTVLNESPDSQLDHILQIWSENIGAYDFFSERIMYLAERITFFPTFKSNEVLFECIGRIEEAIKPSETDSGYYERDYLNAVHKLLKNILLYTKDKLQPDALIKREELDERQARKLYSKFKHRSESIQSFVDMLEEHSDCQFNRILKILAYDYAALSRMKSMAYKDGESLEELLYLEKCFIEVITLAEEDSRSDELWNGYAYFNLARLYEKMHRFTGDASYIDKMRRAIAESLFYRDEWLEAGLEGAFGTALAYEYFLASEYDYETRFYVGAGDQASDDADSIVAGLKELRSELGEYCESVEIGRLFEIRDSIDRLIRNIHSQTGG